MSLPVKIAVSLIVLVGAAVIAYQWQDSKHRQAQLHEGVAEWRTITHDCAEAERLYEQMRQEYISFVDKSGSLSDYSQVKDNLRIKSDELDQRLRKANEAATRLYRQNRVFASAVTSAHATRWGQPSLPADQLNYCEYRFANAITFRLSTAEAK